MDSAIQRLNNRALQCQSNYAVTKTCGVTVLIEPLRECYQMILFHKMQFEISLEFSHWPYLEVQELICRNLPY